MFQLNDVKPVPIKDRLLHESQIWATPCRFEKGKCYLVTAPSGKGKSTFIHILYGLRKDYSGQVYLNNKPVLDLTLNELAAIRQEKVAIVFQDLRLFPQLTGLENIQLKAALKATKTTAEILAMAAQLGIENVLHQTAQTLSYGQQQRVAIIRALCQPFDMLLLDEPFSHLDTANIKAATQLITATCMTQKAGMILVSLGAPYFFEYDEELLL